MGNKRITSCGNARKRKRNSLCGSYKNKRRKHEKVPTIVTTSKACCFCHNGENIELGNFFQEETAQIAAHQFCLFFSAGLPQRGEDSEGFDGFLFSDILKEAQRANTINCKICHNPGASSGCSVKSCRSAYHYKCGKDAGMQFTFTGAFDSYCKSHRSLQDLRHIRRLKVPVKCPVCLDEITIPDHKTIVKTPCCKHVYIHKRCVQEQANASGYFFRCPTCNDSKRFPGEMVQYGIFTPLRDAAWEANDAYSDLLEQYGKCDIHKCKCRNGRLYQTQSGKWHLLRCYVCGQSGVHVCCLGKRYIPGIGYVCGDCNHVVSLTNDHINTLQSQTENRLQEHKRRLQELTARHDPVLLASPVFAAPIWRKKFNIKPSFVMLERITLPLPSIVEEVKTTERTRYSLKACKAVDKKLAEETFSFCHSQEDSFPSERNIDVSISTSTNIYNRCSFSLRNSQSKDGMRSYKNLSYEKLFR